MPSPARRASAALAVVLAAACGDAVGPTPAEGRPVALVYDYGGWPDIRSRVSLSGDTVTLLRRQPLPGDGVVTTTTARVPSADEWRAFWREVDAAGVRRWPARCVNSSAQDGGGYEFTLAWPGGQRSGVYVNASPTGAGRCSSDDSADSRRFTRAVLLVAGYAPPGA